MCTKDYILLALNSFCQVLLVWRFIRIFFSPRLEKRKEIVGYFLYWVEILAVFLWLDSPIGKVFLNWLGILLLTTMYEGTFRKKGLVGTSIYVLEVVCGIAIVFSFSAFVSVESIPPILSLFITLFVFILQILVEVILRDLGKTKLKLSDIKLVGVPVISIIMMAHLILENSNHHVLVLVEAYGLVFINMLLFFVDYQKFTEDEAKMQWKHTEEEVRMYKNQLERMRLSQERVRSLRHDMRHHLQLLYVMAEKGQSEKILYFLEEMMTFLENTKQHITTGREDVDAILNYSWEKAEQLGVEMECKVSISPDFFIQMCELSGLLGNLLENAIEAATKAQKPYVSLRLLAEKDMLVLHVKNSYNGVIERRGKQLISTKTRDRNEHGIGLSSVRSLVEQKQGNLQVDYDEKEFRVEVVLYT